jgi:hypothetical protein
MIKKHRQPHEGKEDRRGKEHQPQHAPPGKMQAQVVVAFQPESPVTAPPFRCNHSIVTQQLGRAEDRRDDGRERRGWRRERRPCRRRTPGQGKSSFRSPCSGPRRPTRPVRRGQTGMRSYRFHPRVIQRTALADLHESVDNRGSTPATAGRTANASAGPAGSSSGPSRGTTRNMPTRARRGSLSKTCRRRPALGRTTISSG